MQSLSKQRSSTGDWKLARLGEGLANNKTGSVKKQEQVTYSGKDGGEAAESYYHRGLHDYGLANLC